MKWVKKTSETRVQILVESKKHRVILPYLSKPCLVDLPGTGVGGR